MELRGATVVVTGGSRGIGAGLVRAFAAEGANIVVGDLLGVAGIEQACAETCREAEQRGAKTTTVDVDVRDEVGCRRLVQVALDTFGRLDVVCANAGVISLAPVAELSAQEWDRVMDINAKGVFLTCKAAVPHFVERKHGCFVNTASIAGKRGGPGVSHYCASKFAVVGFTQSLAMEMGPHNVRANAICPGYLGTSMWLNDILGRQREAGRDTREIFERVTRERVPLGREQTPDDIGQAAVYLARADNVTGIALNVAGGLEVW
jgi:meso-butanediol dehydrogenase/(S,S)-butanediol dehydrogenase/diacetyl reductase